MDPRLYLKDNLEHARWRVRFVRSLLDVHQHCMDATREEWWIEEAALLQRLAAAEDELKVQGCEGCAEEMSCG
jgi:hypothetical protein